MEGCHDQRRGCGQKRGRGQGGARGRRGRGLGLLRNAAASTCRMSETNRQSHRHRQQVRHQTLQENIASLSEDHWRQLLVRLSIRMPSLVFDIMELIDQPPPSPPPPNPAPLVPGWCRCSQCRPMATQVEEVCCNMLPINCLNQRPEMDILVLDPAVLAIANLYRADMLAVGQRHDNDARRHGAYRQFILWRYGRLGRGDRRVIPSCCVWRIRDEYPSADGTYTGFLLSRLA